MGRGRGELSGEKYASTSSSDIQRENKKTSAAEILYGHLQRSEVALSDAQPWWWPPDGIDVNALDLHMYFFENELLGEGWYWSGGEDEWAARTPALPELWKSGSRALMDDTRTYLEELTSIDDPTRQSYQCRFFDWEDSQHIKIRVTDNRYNPSDEFENILVNVHQIAAVESLVEVEGQWRFLELEADGESYKNLIYIDEDVVLGSVKVNYKQ